MIMSVKDKNVIITGASRGIGKAIATLFASKGANIAMTNLADDDEFQSSIADVAAFGTTIKGYVFDVANFEQTDSAIKQIVVDFGTIDIVINNAGVTSDSLLLRMTEQQWDLVMSVNLKSVFNVTKAIIPTMSRRKQGAIINISSVVGESGNAGQSNYAASKAGIIGFTKSIAKEYGSRNIRVNAVAPGFIETAMTAAINEDIKKEWLKNIPLRRGGTFDDVANAVLFLASDQSSYITGQVLNVCGGMHI